MDSQPIDATWWSPNNYSMPQHQTNIYELPPDISSVPSLSGSPASSTYDHFPGPIPQEYYPHMVNDVMQIGTYQIPMTPSELGSDHDSPYCSPRPLSHAEPVYQHSHMSQVAAPGERQHTTSGRRRAQNRAAQRAFRERKEKHARDLEAQLAVLTDKYNKLESSHTELNAAYGKLRKTIELLTQDDLSSSEDESDKQSRRRGSHPDTLRKLLEILHGEYRGAAVKSESP